MPLHGLGQSLLVGRSSCIIARLVLIERSCRHCIFCIKLLIARKISLRQRELRFGRIHLSIALVRLLHDILRIDDHEHITRTYTLTDLHITVQDLPANLKGHIRLITAAHGACIRSALC